MADPFTYIWQSADWPQLRWDESTLAPAVRKVEELTARVCTTLTSLSGDLLNWVAAESTAQEAVSTSAIEGVHIDLARARSSLMRRLGLGIADGQEWKLDEASKGIVELVADASANAGPLTHERLKAWHQVLFPTARSGLRPILTGEYRASAEPMQVVSPARYGHKVHFEAPPADHLDVELDLFLDWFNLTSRNLSGSLRGGVAHLWFETLHPFEDGNGRIGRAIWDLAVMQSAPQRDPRIARIWSLSPTINRVKQRYYEELEHAQKDGIDITRWLIFSLQCMEESLKNSIALAERVAKVSRFWARIRDVELDARQRKVLDAVLLNNTGDDFVTPRLFVKLTHCSAPTASRAIADLVTKTILELDPEKGGRSTRYRIALDEPAAQRIAPEIDWAATKE